MHILCDAVERLELKIVPNKRLLHFRRPCADILFKRHSEIRVFYIGLRFCRPLHDLVVLRDIPSFSHEVDRKVPRAAKQKRLCVPDLRARVRRLYDADRDLLHDVVRVVGIMNHAVRIRAQRIDILDIRFDDLFAVHGCLLFPSKKLLDFLRQQFSCAFQFDLNRCPQYTIFRTFLHGLFATYLQYL